MQEAKKEKTKKEKEKLKSRNRSTRAGLIFPVVRYHRLLKVQLAFSPGGDLVGRFGLRFFWRRAGFLADFVDLLREARGTAWADGSNARGVSFFLRGIFRPPSLIKLLS